jgi:SAM-dependent methyltransferase
VSRERLEEHRRLWASKPVLADVYGVWFDALLRELPATGRVLEVGAGPGFFGNYARRTLGSRWIATDIVETPWNDVVADALRLPARSGALGAVVGLDVVHHLARPRTFFEEAARVLAPGGRLVVVEPWVTPFSYPIYRFLHHEGCDDKIDPWHPFDDGASKEAFEGDGGLFTRIVRSLPPEGWRELGLGPPRVTLLNAFAYLLSLGFRSGSLLPRSAAPMFLALDERLRAASSLLGMRALCAWEKPHATVSSRNPEARA